MTSTYNLIVFSKSHMLETVPNMVQGWCGKEGYSGVRWDLIR